MVALRRPAVGASTEAEADPPLVTTATRLTRAAGLEVEVQRRFVSEMTGAGRTVVLFELAYRLAFGVAAHSTDVADLLALVADADRALYAAEESGRNRVVGNPRRDDLAAAAAV